MNTIVKLTDTQRQVLEHAAEHPERLISWFPAGVKGGARHKVLEGLQHRALITGSDSTFVIAPAGYDALGRTLPASPTQHPQLASNNATAGTQGDLVPVVLEPIQFPARATAETKPHRRENSKQALVLQMLRRAEGATLSQICAATGWQKHTVRGTFAGSFKRKLGLTITSNKADEGERVYHVA